MTTVQPATYGGHKLQISLEHSIGMSFFEADSRNYMKQLADRSGMPASLKALLAELFRQGAITKCTITFGTRMDLEVSRIGGKGQLLLSNGALAQFQQKFARISGRPVVASWTATSARTGHRAGSGDVASALAWIVDSVADGLVVAAAIDQLFGD